MTTLSHWPNVWRGCVALFIIAVLASACGTPNAVKTKQTSNHPGATPTSHVSVSPTPAIPVPPNTFFDDFSYTSQQQMAANGWIIRQKAGGPGSAAATWSPNNVAIVADPDQAGNKILELTGATGGTDATTQEALVCQQRTFFDGTYAARVKFTDQSSAGSIDDNVVETFYTISAPESSSNPYSELDNEYLPNGGWGGPPLSLYMITWRSETDRIYKIIHGSLDDWHTIVVQVANNTVKYYLDGQLMETDDNGYYPQSPMSLDFSVWFASLESSSSVMRNYSEEVDWVYFAGGQTISPDQITADVANARQAKVSFMDSTAAWPSTVPAPCRF